MVEYIRAWVIGAVAWFMLTNLGTLAFGVLAPAEHLRSFGWALLWLGGIGFAAYFLSAVAAAAVHRAPDRHRFGRNAAAVLAAPVVGTAVDTARLLTGTGVNWALYGSWTAIALAGAVLGFVLMRRVQAPVVLDSATGERVRVPRTYWDRTESAATDDAEPGEPGTAESGNAEPGDAEPGETGDADPDNAGAGNAGKDMAGAAADTGFGTEARAEDAPSAAETDRTAP
ncbi:hypothetical protein GCM10027570_34320 [Streptomonospora sediminis]